ncbi:MAG TPA: hypothetical protein VHF88_02335 [Thermoleophilaceae bacterium]|nr:hypothetical protein [Thermoleophilaceae bacterium]
MEPRYSMAAYAAVVGAVLVLLALSGEHSGAAWAAAGLLAIASALDVTYVAQRRRLAREAPYRSKFDRMVRIRWVLAGIGSLALIAAAGALDLAPLDGQGRFVDAVLLCSTVGALGVFVSSLVDWYWILPKVSGIVCPAPCEAPGGERWESPTGHWYFHRGVATLLVSGMATGICGYMAATTDDQGEAAIWGVVALVAISTAVVKFNEQGIKALWYGFSPPIHVGDTILAERHTEGPVERRRAYVVDVSLQGARYKFLIDGRYAGTRFGTKGDQAPIPNDDLLGTPRAEPIAVCSESCTGINWYCRYNPSAHDKVRK